ncbi:MAG TPA: PAS domain S-box protein [Terriglobales bacterium]|nr:PAS domain S-box protein [Terriglobales bacterium]
MPFLAFIASVVGVALLLLLRIFVRQHQTIQQQRAQLATQAQLLRDSERREDLMFSTNPYPMWVYDRKTLRLLKVNDAAVKAYGYSREELLGMTILDIRPEEDKPALLKLVQEDTDGYRNVGIWRFRRKDGSLLWMEIMGFVVNRDDHSEKLVLALDVTERYRMEQALRESEAMLKSLVDNAPFGIAQSYVEANRWTAVNPALRKMLGGYSQEEALQLNLREQIYADPKQRDRLLEVLQRSGRVEGWETTLRRRDGSLFPVRVTGLLSGGNGAPKVFSAYVEDLTQQSALEQQVRQVQKLEAVGRLAGGMAHDFNNILVVIKLSTELMLGQITPDSPLSKPLLQISNAADRAAALTRQMLAFGRQQIMQPRVINLNAVVSDTIQMLRRVIGEDIHLVTSLSEEVENSYLDPDQVAQVILNLAVNARDAMPQGGTLHLETANVNLDEAYAANHPPVQPGRYVMLAVSDTGTGIDKSILPRIFDPFFTTKETGKGTGLGLSIVYGIVKQSGGYVWVYSEPGHGTTFKLYFPATTATLQQTTFHTEATVRPAGQRLLVVEDEVVIRSNVCACLEQLGYRVLQAESATVALQVCQEVQGKIDLVLTDMVMAEKSGHELAADLIKRYPGIRVLFMSGYSEDTVARRDIMLRGSLFLQKPFSVADLAKAVQDALVQRRVVMPDLAGAPVTSTSGK